MPSSKTPTLRAADAAKAEQEPAKPTAVLSDKVQHKARIGDIVHFVDGRRVCIAAIVVGVIPIHTHAVDLKYFDRRRLDATPLMQAIPWSADPKVVNTWHEASLDHD